MKMETIITDPRITRTRTVTLGTVAETITAVSGSNKGACNKKYQECHSEPLNGGSMGLYKTIFRMPTSIHFKGNQR